MRGVVWGTILYGLFGASPGWSQTPCLAPPIGRPVPNPTGVIVEGSPDHGRLTAYVLGIFLEGVDPAMGGKPLTELAIPLTAFKPLTGIPNCFEAAPSDLPKELAARPAGQLHRAAFKSRPADGGADSLWSPLAPDPFIRTGPHLRLQRGVGSGDRDADD